MRGNNNLRLAGLVAAAAVALGTVAMQAQTTTPDQTQPGANAPSERQNRRGQMGENREQRFQELSQKLNLTPDQQTKVKAIMDQRRNDMMALRNDTSLTPDQKRDKAQQINQSFHTQMQGVLTPDQQKQFQELHGGKGKGYHKHGRKGEKSTPPQS